MLGARTELGDGDLVVPESIARPPALSALLQLLVVPYNRALRAKGVVRHMSRQRVFQASVVSATQITLYLRSYTSRMTACATISSLVAWNRSSCDGGHIWLGRAGGTDERELESETGGDLCDNWMTMQRTRPGPSSTPCSSADESGLRINNLRLTRSHDSTATR
ncbi:hypothetical protein EXIGLDRAFT_768169 [Exidia glandulosa HHB12029]|uniref:Uncharacterized protein n=1 Tax=Exidia glandulosa HHB12029 TaxID=1314781 RepID=A0A166ALY6_EXIGL|nr:hypothetical protein EXIGLDRAFT_768169 [Exidia glandulosa HHB12029]